MNDDDFEKLALVVARSDAAFDKRPWDSMGRGDRERYLERAKAGMESAVACMKRDGIPTRDDLAALLRDLADWFDQPARTISPEQCALDKEHWGQRIAAALTLPRKSHT